MTREIEFEKSDYEYPKLETFADEFASFLYKRSSYIFGVFVDFMRTSGTVTLAKHKRFIQTFFVHFKKRGKNTAPDILQLEELCNNFFSICNSDDEVRKMRGLIPEKLFEKIFEQRHKGKACTIGYGVKVLINGEAVIYNPPEKYKHKEDSDGYRQTVDAGFWDGYNGEFAEIKLQPHAFQTKDINYLSFLAEMLKASDIAYSIFLVTLGNKELIQKKLERLGLINEGTQDFVLIGRGELFQLESSL
jgi:hypothetical protein